MLFPTAQFAIFFAIVLPVSWWLMPRQPLWKPFVLLASYVFYATANPKFCLLLGGITLWNQAAAKLIHRSGDDAPPAVADDRRGRRRPPDARRLQVLRLLHPGHRPRPPQPRARPAAAARDDRPPGRRQLLHLPGDLLHRRRQAPADRAGVDDRRGDLPQLLPPPDRRPDRPRPASSSPSSRPPATPAKVAASSGLLLIGLGLVKKVVLADYLGRVVVDPVFAVPQGFGAPDVLLAGVRLRRADLLRLLRLHRHGDRPRPPDGLRLPPELPQPLPGDDARRLLGPLAHDAVALPARLPLHPARRQPPRPAASPTAT